MKNKIESEKYDNYPPQERVLTLFPLSRKERRILHTGRGETHSPSNIITIYIIVCKAISVLMTILSYTQETITHTLKSICIKCH